MRQQLKQEGKGEMSLVGFYEFYLQCTAGFARAFSENFEDVFEIADMIQKICRYASRKQLDTDATVCESVTPLAHSHLNTTSPLTLLCLL